MDPRIKTLIAAAKLRHKPLFTSDTYEGKKSISWCEACLGLVYECPVLKAAKELEAEDDNESDSN